MYGFIKIWKKKLYFVPSSNRLNGTKTIFYQPLSEVNFARTSLGKRGCLRKEAILSILMCKFNQVFNGFRVGMGKKEAFTCIKCPDCIHVLSRKFEIEYIHIFDHAFFMR